MCLLTCGHIQHMYSWWWVGLSPKTCRVKHLRRINRNCCISELFHYKIHMRVKHTTQSYANNPTKWYWQIWKCLFEIIYVLLVQLLWQWNAYVVTHHNETSIHYSTIQCFPASIVHFFWSLDIVCIMHFSLNCHFTLSVLISGSWPTIFLKCSFCKNYVT